MGACGSVGGCGACGSTEPLPGGKLPPDQTVEGGAQIRVTQGGFQKITSVLPGLLNQSIGQGFCIGDGDVSLAGFPLASYCFNNQGQCQPGCRVVPTLNSTSVSVTNANKLNVRVAMDIDVNIPIDTFITSPCTVRITTLNTSDIIVDVDIDLGIKPADGELTINVAGINNIDLGGIRFSSNGGAVCDIAAGAGNFLTIILDFLASNLSGLLTPIINNVVQGLIPSPLGVAGMIDMGNLLGGISPGTSGSMEARIVPGGYVRMNNNGMSLGVITGLNADFDTTTRGPGLASEPALCVPPIPAPNFGAPPANLPITSRQTFALGAANEFNGVPEPPGADVAMGLSETTLDLAGHHAVTSGAMCLGIGTSFINQLNVGTIGILVPSLSELQSDNGNDPLLLVTRPTRALDFSIGDNTPTNPAITIHVSHMEVDFYAFLYERYTRAFTLDLSMDVGVNLEFEQTPTGAVIKPSLVGISADTVTLSVLNSEFVRETPAELEMVLPSVFDLITPLLGDLPPVNVPTFAGFKLENLSIAKVVTAQDDFLSLNATLGASAQLKQLAGHDKFAADALKNLTLHIPGDQPTSNGRSNLIKVHTPKPEEIRKALKKQGGAMPTVEFGVDRFDNAGRELEWAYNLNGGMFHIYQPAELGGKLTIADRAFAWQGKYTIGLKSRVKGDYHTTSQPVFRTVNIDSVPPRVLTEKAEWVDDSYHVTIFDIVSGNYVQYALGKPTGDGPETEWFQGGYAQLSRSELQKYAVGGEVALYTRDEEGNQAVALIAPFHGAPGEGGCTCDSTGGPSTGGIALILIVGFMLVGRRRTAQVVRQMARVRVLGSVVAWVGLSVTLSLVPGCDCGSNAGKACETEADCGPDFCPPGEIAFCIDSTCVCSDDIVMGRLGPYSDVAVSPTGDIWVSAYHQQYGDLVVAHVDPQVGRIPNEAWEWVDGVPDGPVIVPQSKFRHGIAAKGEDVGMYTSIAIAPDGTPMVTYFDRDTGSLKFAARVGGVWQSHVIEQGTGELGETGALIGMYTSLSLRSDDGRPGVAYLAHVSDAQMGPRAEVRFAASQSAIPGSAADWMTWIVDTAPLPPVDADNPNIYPLPEGLGLFVDLARLPSQEPVVVYYDRTAGDLKVAKFNPTAGQFGVATILDGAGDVDAGWSPSVGVDSAGVVHVAYVNATNDDLMYMTDAAGAVPQLVDDGRRVDGTTVDGLPKPEFHFVGDDAGMVLANGGTLPMIAYQDATTQELLLVTRQQDGTWARSTIAGDTTDGAYGFFAADAVAGTEIFMSTWVIDQPNDDNWVEVFRRQTAIQ
ncbi:MAG: hypothetical protein ABI867_08435 [Kofleriaceae bacterium]